MSLLLRALLPALCFAAVSVHAAEKWEMVPAPKAAPAWKLKDVDGQVISSDQFRGKVILVDFWATWCAPCRSEMPGYVALQAKYGDSLVIIGIATDVDKNGPNPLIVKRFLAKNTPKITYQVVMDDGDVETAFGGMDAIPTSFIIDRGGVLRERKRGSVPMADTEKRLLPYLKPVD
jgi:thiol-disulfide isomerase/thioredoxin